MRSRVLISGGGLKQHLLRSHLSALPDAYTKRVPQGLRVLAPRPPTIQSSSPKGMNSSVSWAGLESWLNHFTN